MSSPNDVSVPGYFPFPFPPYDIQEDFMKNLYNVLDNEGVGIFESPTGTGKSLSLICGSLTWLRDYENKQKDERDKIIGGRLQSTSVSVTENNNNNKDSSEMDWIDEFAEKRAQKEIQDQIKEKEDKKMKAKLKLQQIRSRPGKVTKRKHSEACREDMALEKLLDKPADDGMDIDDTTMTKEEDVDKDIVVEEYHSENEQQKVESSDEEDLAEEEHVTKIYYCSRTHSQLAQFVKEIQKSPFPDTSVVTLGSRQNLCINEDVKRLKSINRINEKCLDLQKKKKEKKNKVDVEVKRRKKTTTSGCPFYEYKKFHDYRELVLAEVQDIEELVSLGHENETCPYYGTRLTIPPAQVVVLPYNVLLHRSTREAYGIKLSGNIIIIDEAHNLIDTISNIYSVEITGLQMSSSHSQLSQYLEKYKNRLKAKNLMYIKQLLFLLSRLLVCLGVKVSSVSSLSSPTQTLAQDQPNQGSSSTSDVKLWTINDFLFSAEIDNMNLFKIQKYCEKSLIAKKLSGFVDKYREDQANDDNIITSPLQHIQSFLEALTNADKDGRIVVNKQGKLSESSIKFLLLNPAVHFTSIVKECRAVIVAGGTMQPTSEFKEQLFASACVSPEKVLEFSCGHVIPHGNLVAVSLSKGPTGINMDFTYQSRESPQLIEELGRVLVNICTVVPGGVVCFFSSYDYEQTIYSHWEKSGLLERLAQRKRIFREPRKTSNMDQILSDYSRCIKRTKSVSSGGTTGCGQPSGALLLSVVGGKMSEGINFSDDLGRCIVMVGLPYPNIKSPELKEKMDYLNSTIGPRAGQVHYENLCMKAVNQSIGRAIRHKGDYATILLLDQRYPRANVSGKLPGWISTKLTHHARFGPAFSAVRKFFVDKRPSNSA